MRRQEDPHSFMGMQQDFAISKQLPKYLIDARNIRLTLNQDSTLLSITNEKGPGDMEVLVEGTYLGHCVINNYVVVFSSYTNNNNKYDIITRLHFGDDNIEKIILYKTGHGKGTLGFSTEHPIQTLGYYETENVQKVYWVDGLNQPRVINIVNPNYQSFTSNSFDFVQELEFQERISVKKDNTLQGTFAPGTIQYAFSYFNLYGQESNIFYTTPLMYTSYLDRAGSENDKCSCVFQIRVANVDSQFDYLRIYSIQRTSLDATPIVKRVSDLEITSEVLLFTDNGMYGENVDPNYLLYVGGESISANTICQKDNTLFLGDIKLKRREILLPDEIKNKIRQLPITSNSRKIKLYKISDSPYPYYTGLHATSYTENNEIITSWNTSGFKHGEYYRLGIQFQYKDGRWSIPIWINDFKETSRPEQLQDTLWMPSFWLDPGDMTDSNFSDILDLANSLGYKRVRPVVVLPREEERTILCQGVVNPTLFTKKDRFGIEDSDAVIDNPRENIYAQSSWFFRAMTESGNCGYDVGTGGVSPQSRGTLTYPDRFNMLEPVEVTETVEGTQETETRRYRDYHNCRGIEMCVCRNPNKLYNIDWNMLTLNSPDLDMWDYFYNTQLDNCELYDIGSIQINKTLSDIQIFTETPPILEDALGFIRYTVSGTGACGLISGPFYNDGIVLDDFTGAYFPFILPNENDYRVKDFLQKFFMGNTSEADVYTGEDEQKKSMMQSVRSFYQTYLWQKEGSLNNDITRNITVAEGNSNVSGVQSALLKSKIISNLRISNDTYYSPNENKINMQGSPIFYRNQQAEVQKINNHTYYGNADQLIAGDTHFGSYIWLKRANEKDMQNENTFNSMPLNVQVVGANFSPEEGTYPASWVAVMPTPYCSNNVQNDNVTPGARKVWGLYQGREGDGTIFSKPNIWDDIMPDWKLGQPWWNGSKWGDIGNKFQLLAKKSNVRIKYKSSPHIVLQLTANKKYCWPNQNDDYIRDNYTSKVEDGDPIIQLPQGSHQIGENSAFLPIVELRRPYDVNTMFGGQTDYALQQNHWLPAGEPLSIQDVDQGLRHLEWVYGDTWYQRYDCLKTYPYSESDTNQLVELLSFMVETHVNLEGRYDKNRGQLSNLTVSPSNFNRLNEVYSQHDNFFNYQILPENYYETTHFGNQFVWSLEKHPAEQVDNWTNVNLGSSYNLGGTLGDIVKIVCHNEQLYAFQKNGIARILFNSRVQIPTSDGTPIEISNNYKVEGAQYISQLFGSNNSDSICPTDYGIYFIDSLGGELQLLTEKQVTNVSQDKGVTLWFRRQLNKQWLPDNYSIKLFFDKKDNDLYIVSPDETLLFSDKLKEFISYLPYCRVPAMFNIEDSLYLFKDSQKVALYKMFAGTYNNFFDEIQPYSITFTSNGVAEQSNNSMLSKMFTNLDFRGDCRDADFADFNQSNINYPKNKCPFSHIRVWNEYQDTGQTKLNFKIPIGTNTEKKFRVWRVDIPRNKKLFDKKASGVMDRIANTWCKIQLTNMSPQDNETMQLHDMNVTYYI